VKLGAVSLKALFAGQHEQNDPWEKLRGVRISKKEDSWTNECKELLPPEQPVCGCSSGRGSLIVSPVKQALMDWTMESSNRFFLLCLSLPTSHVAYFFVLSLRCPGQLGKLFFCMLEWEDYYSLLLLLFFPPRYMCWGDIENWCPEEPDTVQTHGGKLSLPQELTVYIV